MLYERNIQEKKEEMLNVNKHGFASVLRKLLFY